MFLMFALGREDIFSHGDLGLKNAIKKLYNLEKYDVHQVEEIVIKWCPYRTYASRILWRSLGL
jgi:DNA-3-methyladenine glycosylase II